MKPFRLTPAVLLLVLVASTTFADVTIKVTASISGPMPFGDIPFVLYVKGMKMRSDHKWSDTDRSILIDVAAKKTVWIDHMSKEVSVAPPDEPLNFYAVARGLQCPSCQSTASIKPNGHTKEVLGTTCNGFDVTVNQTMTIKGVTVVTSGRKTKELAMITSGPAWVEKEGTGIAEYRAFPQAASAAGLLVWPVGWGDPVGLGAEAKGIIEMQKALAEVGVPLLQEWKSRLDGTTVTMRVTEISADPIPDDTFAVPAGYTKK